METRITSSFPASDRLLQSLSARRANTSAWLSFFLATTCLFGLDFMFLPTGVNPIYYLLYASIHVYMLTLSLIIPVYNEERHIQECLDAVAAQTRMPDEVIVVDNNCTDATIKLVKKYSFVTVIKEPAQGRGHARSAGFNAAHGQVLARIDVDSVIDRDWVEKIVKAFEEDNDLSGITGLGQTSYLPAIRSLKNTLISRTYFWFVHANFNTVTMWGANMAIRSSSWKKVKSQVCLDDSLVHEDQDLSLCMAANGDKIVFQPDLQVTTNTQSFRYLGKLIHYSQLFKDTKAMHEKNGNLASPKMRRLGFWNTLFGRVLAIVFTTYIGTVSLVFFPVDYLVYKYWPNSRWLD